MWDWGRRRSLQNCGQWKNSQHSENYWILLAKCSIPQAVSHLLITRHPLEESWERTTGLPPPYYRRVLMDVPRNWWARSLAETFGTGSQNLRFAPKWLPFNGDLPPVKRCKKVRTLDCFTQPQLCSFLKRRSLTKKKTHLLVEVSWGHDVVFAYMKGVY